MPELAFFTGPMECGKSTLALQVDHTQRTGGREGRIFTCLDRGGEGRIVSRIGLERPAIEVDVTFDFWSYVIGQLVAGTRVEYLVCDEAQFYTRAQIDQLARIVDELQVDVFCFGLLTDFRASLFPGSARLVELCDRMEVLHVKPLCWCGSPATHNARTVDGEMVVDGSQVVVGDTEGDADIRYEVLCRRHHRARVTAARARANLTPDPLPFDRPDPDPDWDDSAAVPGDGLAESFSGEDADPAERDPDD